jgi:hypothetical protein
MKNKKLNDFIKTVGGMALVLAIPFGIMAIWTEHSGIWAKLILTDILMIIICYYADLMTDPDKA